MEWEKEDIINFIEIYRHYELIWDPKHPDHFNKFRKKDAWEEIAKKVNRSSDECKRKMEYLLAALRRERMKMTKSIGTGKGTEEVYKSSWFAFEAMKFLWDKNKPRSTLSSLPITTGNSPPEMAASENTEDHETSDGENLEERTHFLSSEKLPEPPATENSGTKYTAAAKRLHPQTQYISKSKKRQIPADERLENAFAILTSTANNSTPQDDSQHFGNLIASKLRRYDDDIRCTIQSEILNIFISANRGAYNRVGDLPSYVHDSPHTSQTYSSAYPSPPSLFVPTTSTDSSSTSEHLIQELENFVQK